MLLCWWVILIILVFLSRSPFTRLCLYCINCRRNRIIVTNSKKVDLALLLVMFLVLGLSAADTFAQLTPAGTVITNQATLVTDRADAVDDSVDVTVQVWAD